MFRRQRNPHKYLSAYSRNKHSETGDCLTMYFKNASRHNLLSVSEEIDAAKNYEKHEIQCWKSILDNDVVINHIFKTLVAKVTRLTTKRNMKIHVAKRLRDKIETKVFDRQLIKSLRFNDSDRAILQSCVKKLDSLITDSPGITKCIINIKHHYNESLKYKDILFCGNIRLVISIAKGYSAAVELQDLIQDGNIGLLTAIEKYNVKLGYRLTTYATNWIKHCIGRAIDDNGRTVRLPVHAAVDNRTLHNFTTLFYTMNGRKPYNDEIINNLGMKQRKIDRIQQSITNRLFSLDAKYDDGDDKYQNKFDSYGTLKSSERSPLDNFEIKELRKEVGRLLKFLTPIEKDVIEKRFGIGNDKPLVLRTVGEGYSISRERIRQIQNTAILKMRKHLNKDFKV